MSAYATKQDVEEIVGKAVDKAVTDLSEIISTFAQQVDIRFNKLEAQVDAIDTRLENVEIKVVSLGDRLVRVEEKITEQDQKFDRLLNTIDGFVGRIDRYETEQLIRDNQFNRLLEWARKVSEKTGIPLENI
jgi:chromosome segregation ATPase